MNAMNRVSGLTALAIICTTLLGTAGLALATEPGTYAKALADAKAANQMVVMDFYTDW